MNSEIWKITNAAVPRVVLQAIPIDRKLRVMLMHRSANLRSARNVWSFPTGLHEVGENWHDGVSRELDEEYSLTPSSQRLLGLYENIAGDDDNPTAPQWHWTILLVGVLVDDVTVAVNNEPEKHDEMAFVHVDELKDPQFLKDYIFHSSFSRYLAVNCEGIVSKLKELAGCGEKQ